MRPPNEGPNSAKLAEERRLAFITACTVASVFLTRWCSSRTSRFWRSSKARRCVMSRWAEIQCVIRPPPSRTGAISHSTM